MIKPSLAFFVSQTALIGLVFRISDALLKHDWAPLTLASIAGFALWYAGYTLQLPFTGLSVKAKKAAAPAIFAGAVLIVIAGLSRMFE